MITGITGLLGSHLARTLINKGYQIRALVRKGGDKSLISDIIQKIDFIEGDLDDVPFIEGLFDDIDILIHCAAIVSFDPKDRPKLFRVNVAGTKILVDEANKAGVSRMIHVSSVAAIGRKQGLRVLNENIPWDTSGKTSKYAVSKYLAELEVARAAAEGLNTVVVCPSIILGPGYKGKSSSRLLEYVYHSKPFFTEGIANVVDVRDVCYAIAHLCEQEQINGKFIVSGHALTYKALFDLLAKSFRKRPPSIKVPSSLIPILWRIEWLRSKATGVSPLITKETSVSARSSYTYDNSKSIQELGLEYRPLEDTAQFCMQMFVDN